MTNLAVLADDGRALDRHAVPTTVPAPMKTCSPTHAPPTQGWCRPGAEMFREVGFDFLERIPRVFAALEEGGVLGLRQVKQV